MTDYIYLGFKLDHHWFNCNHCETTLVSSEEGMLEKEIKHLQERHPKREWERQEQLKERHAQKFLNYIK